ncbi:hypothetical protein [Variovorax sp. GT1P44]|uniref:hypothetical protein n=1 Tax=Variovorax sp. GT1P44 TaxID=3443742 RepID=UPI003F48024E
MKTYLRILIAVTASAAVATAQAQVRTGVLAPYGTHVYWQTFQSGDHALVALKADGLTRISVFNGYREICHQTYSCEIFAFYGSPEVRIEVRNYAPYASSYKIASVK